jgi:hypothetical protein
VGRQGQERCASITCMIRHYVARRAQVSEAHPYNAAKSARPIQWLTESPWCSISPAMASGSHECQFQTDIQ